MARVQQGIKLVKGTYTTPKEIMNEKRWLFLEVLSRTVPDVLGDLASDEILEQLFDSVNPSIFYADNPKAFDYGVKSWEQLSGAIEAPRAELKEYLTDWFNGCGLNDTWEWIFDAVISTLWYWREQEWRGHKLSTEHRLIWRRYTRFSLVTWNETTRMGFSHIFESKGLHNLARDALYEEAKEVFDKAFGDFYTNYVQARLGGAGEPAEVVKQKTLKNFERLALFQFYSHDTPMLKKREGVRESTIRTGLDAACDQLEVTRRRDAPGRKTK